MKHALAWIGIFISLQLLAGCVGAPRAVRVGAPLHPLYRGRVQGPGGSAGGGEPGGGGAEGAALLEVIGAVAYLQLHLGEPRAGSGPGRGPHGPALNGVRCRGIQTGRCLEIQNR